MATYNWTALDDGDSIAFDPFNDVLNVNDTSISAADLVLSATATSIVLSHGGKTVTLVMDCRRATTSNIMFDDGSVLIIGDNKTGIVGDSDANTLNGGDEADFLMGRPGDDSLFGGTGNDMLDGGDGNDRLSGEGGTDTMDGGVGDDLFIVNAASDSVIEEAGGGTDTVRSAVTYTLPPNVENLVLTGSGSVDGTGNGIGNTITGNGGDNELSGSAGDDSLVGSAGDDTIRGGGGGDTIRGSGGNDSLDGGGGNDTLNGGSGNDTLNGASGRDKLIGEDGNDVYVCDGTEVMIEVEGGGIDSMMMTEGISAPDHIENMTYIGTDDNIGFDANGLDNFITGNALNQSMRAGLGNDTVSYAYETNAVIVDLGNETATGSGNDTITGFENALGGAADDTLIGSGVDNLLDGRGGADTMEGGGGNDTYLVDDIDDSVVETDNGSAALADDPVAALDGFTDTVVAAVTYSLEDVQFVENLTLGGTATAGTGNGLNNIITGNNLANALSGLGGSDTLDGGAGNDVLRGGAGADTLNGRQGRDTCTGGGGADRFVFSTALSAKADQITDFSAAADVIRLDNDIFTAFGSFVGELAAGRFISGPGAIAAGDAGDRIIYNTNTGALYYDADGTGGQETATRFATLTNQPAITAADFFIVS